MSKKLNFIELTRNSCPRCGSKKTTISDVFISRAKFAIGTKLTPREAMECKNCKFFGWMDDLTGVKQ